MTLIPTYRATLFTVKPAFALNRDDPQSGRLFWSAAENGSSVLYYSLQGRSSDGSWSDYYDDLRFSSIYDAWMLNDNAEYVFDEANDLWRVFGTEPLTGNFFGGTGRFIDVFHDVSRFRICAHCGGSGTGEYRIYSEEFTLDGLTGGESYGVWVGGMPVTSGNCGDVLGDGTVSYEPVSRTLTLNNAGLYDLFCRYWETDDLDAAYGIFSEHDLNLRLIGRSEIRPGPASAAYDFRSIPRMAEDEYAYYTLDVIGLGTENGNITVIGPGRLDILSEEYGVICEGDFTLRSGSLCICSGDSSAVSVWDGSFDMSGGALTLESPGCDGISLNHDKEAGSTVSFRGGTAVVSAKYDCIWLGDDNDTVRFSGGTLSLFRTDPSGGACASERNMEYNRNGTLVEVAGSDRILQVWDEAKPLSAYATVCFTAKAQPAALTGRLVGKDSILICVDAAAPGQTECRVLLAEYDRKGKMVSIQQKILSVGSETAETEFRVSQDGYLWKCMLTDENVIPMCSGVLMR